jgi:hypothetical protein
VGVDDVLEVDSAVEVFVRFDVAVVVAAARFRVVVASGKKRARPQDEACQAVRRWNSSHKSSAAVFVTP